MAAFNRITVVAYLGRDPELRWTPAGNAVCNLNVASTEKRKGRSGEQEEITTWFRVDVWGKQAEACEKYLQKGAQVYITGRLRLEQYTDREGQTRTSACITADDVQFLGKASDRNGDTDAPQAAKALSDKFQKEPTKGRDTVPIDDLADNDIPF